MAITRTNSSGSTPDNTNTANSKATENATKWTTSPPQGDRTFSWLGGMGGMWGVGKNPTPEIIKAMEKAFARYSADMPEHLEIKTIIIDNNNVNELMYSVMVLCLSSKRVPDQPVVYHTYIIEASNTPIPTDTRQINGQLVEVVKLGSDANDDDLRNIVRTHVEAAYPNRGLFETSAELVQRSVQLDDETQLWSLFINGVLAARQVLEYVFNPDDLNLANAKDDSNLTVHVTKNVTTTVKDLGGLPCRSDITINTVARNKYTNHQNQGLNEQRQSLISKLSGYMDLVWFRDGNGGTNAWAVNQQVQQPQQQANNYLYVPMFVITAMMPEDRQSIAAQLLTLATVSVLKENQQWSFAFMPKKGIGKSKDNDIKDIAGVGYDANFDNNPNGIGFPIPNTKSDTFNLAQLNSLLSVVCHPSMLLAIDVPECGSSTWQHAIFSAASDGDANSINDILEAANNLTNGHFNKFWTGGKICYNFGTRIHLGYYTSADGQKHDIRDIDTLATLNLFGASEQTFPAVRNWSKSFSDETLDPVLRLQWRKSIIDSHSPTYVGYARRNVFNDHFIWALTAACAAAGLILKPDLPYQDNTNDIRTRAPFLGQIVMAPQASGLFGYGGSRSPSGVYNNIYNGYVPTHRGNL